MPLPRTPVDRLQSFQPPFCPRRDCPEHRRTRPGYRYRVHTAYATARGRRIPRFLCLTCRKTFSQRAFSAFYYLKRPELLLPVAAFLNAGAGHRQIARSLGCAHSTVNRLSARLGRHALLLQARAPTSQRHPRPFGALEPAGGRLPQIPDPEVTAAFRILGDKCDRPAVGGNDHLAVVSSPESVSWNPAELLDDSPSGVFR